MWSKVGRPFLRIRRADAFGGGVQKRRGADAWRHDGCAHYTMLQSEFKILSFVSVLRIHETVGTRGNGTALDRIKKCLVPESGCSHTGPHSWSGIAVKPELSASHSLAVDESWQLCTGINERLTVIRTRNASIVCLFVCLFVCFFALLCFVLFCFCLFHPHEFRSKEFPIRRHGSKVTWPCRHDFQMCRALISTG